MVLVATKAEGAEEVGMRRRAFVGGIVATAGAVGVAVPLRAQGDPLPSWNEGPVKQSIVEFVVRTTTPGSRDWVPVPERIATFDNDGTLWTEQPMYVQTAFAVERVRALAARHPEWRTSEPFRSLLADDRAQLAQLGERALLEAVMATHSGVTTEQFRRIVLDWLATARHPRFKRPYTDLVYQPMLELLAFLRANQFKTFIVSGGGIEFMRPWTERVYGIPPEQVVGSSGVTTYAMPAPDRPVLMKEPRVEFIDDGPGKPEGINRFIGRRPVLAFGNSDGDRQMLEWTAAGEGLRFMGLVHHTDAVREYAYDRDSPVGRLDKAWDEAVRRKWLVVDMKNDWKVVYPFELR
jgi:phosphoglycolate phosphatase-like HAD superfamily hydrolase